MTTYCVKYHPTTQKTLFNKEAVVAIKAWLEITNYPKILFVGGPNGCGKTATIKLLTKAFDVHEIDAADLRSSLKISEITQNIKNSNAMTLANIEKWNHHNKKEKQSLVLVDNIELCDKNISLFTDHVFKKSNVRTGIIFVGNSIKLADALLDYSHCLTTVLMSRPSLLELSKLSMDISSKENLRLSRSEIKSLVEKSEYDARQLLHLLEQYSISITTCSNFDLFVSSVSSKSVDLDLVDKLSTLTADQTSDLNTRFSMCLSEPISIYLSLFQNYPDILHDISNAQKVSDALSHASSIYSQICDDQNWELYKNFAVSGCLLPSSIIRSNNNNNPNKPSNFSSFRDMSYNFSNSFNDVKHTTIQNYDKRAQRFTDTQELSHLAQTPFDQNYSMAVLFGKHLEILFTHFTKHKKGKNTSKHEKIQLVNNISDQRVQNSLDELVQHIQAYGLFETDIEKLMQNKEQYLATPQSYYNVVDIRMFKRFLNIFSINNSPSKFLKPHVETAIKYTLLKFLLNNLLSQSKHILVLDTDVDNMIADLSSVWKL